MADLIYPTITHAFLAELEAVARTGQEVVSRAGMCREIHPRLVRIGTPYQRVLLAPQRHNNLFATIAETVWVLAGRNDLTFLSQYLPRAAEFSDDGCVWRGGYGPRLRDWSGVDQIRHVVHTLQRTPKSRQAVIVLFDPTRDNTASRDIPCNNWLHALVRQGRVELSVALRSNDIMWGFSGIDMFMWSVLQELIAHWTSTELGTTSYFIDSLHLYERHYAHAERILADRRAKTVYDFGFTSPRFSTSLEAFDECLTVWFTLEDRIRRGEQIRANEWGAIADDLLGTFLRLIAIYNRFLAGAERSELGEQVAALPESDLKVGAIEYLTRRLHDREFIPLTPREQAFLAYFWNGAQVDRSFAIERVVAVLNELHNKKTRVYGDSWRKHGELLGIFANITRKYDRLEVATAKNVAPVVDESILDTVADLAVYCAKYLTYLAEQHPAAFCAFQAHVAPAIPVETYQGTAGFGAVLQLLRLWQADDTGGDTPLGQDHSVATIRAGYAALEHLLVQTPGSGSPAEKVAAAAKMAAAAVRLLVAASQADGARFLQFMHSVDSL